MRPIAAVVTLLSLTLAACAADDPSAPISVDSELPALSRTGRATVGWRPIAGRCQTTFNPAPLPPPPVHHQTDVGVCQITRLGSSQVVSVQDIDFAAGTQTGRRTFTAANGDELYATHVGTSAVTAPGVVSFSATLTFTGGTGRFEHATGQARALGEATLATRTAVFTFAGVIAYNASDRAGSDHR